MRRTMEVEEQNFEAEEWGIAQQMQRILGEIHYLMQEQILAIEYYSSQRRNYHQVKDNLEKKEDSVNARLENYKQLHQQYIGVKQIYHQILLFTKDKKLLNQRIQKLGYKEQHYQIDNSSNYEIEEVKDPKNQKDKENQITFYRKIDYKWFFIRIIKNYESTKSLSATQILDIEAFLCDGSQKMEKQDNQHELEIMKSVNLWFKQLIFNVQNRKIYRKQLTEILQYIEETIRILFKGLKCSTCNQVFIQTEDGKFVQPCVKLNENDNLHHYSCLFN